ncbi:MAG: inositol monophosphatase family protein [Rhodococcus sp. (in: high G+C Gram-positive bacteria)]
MDDSRSARAALGVTLARSAGEIARRWFDTSALTVKAKQDGSPVTQADREIEQHIRDAVAQHFPTDSFLGEEFEETIGTSQYRWIVDPIDGTKSFVHGVPLYANLIALQEKEEIVFGVINIPNADILMHAERGKGCWKNGTRVHVSDRTELDGAYVMATWLEDWHPDVIVDLHAAGAVLRTWGDAYGYMMVACGQAEAIVDYTTQTYDLAPMPVIIEEAGGMFTSLDGARDFDCGNGIASNGAVHDSVLKIVNQG